MPGERNIIHCTKCKKVLAEGTITDGRISLKCKCGTMNTIEAIPPKEPKSFVYNAPYQNRLNIVKKDN